MRQIKFRGISTKTGKFVYGYYVPQCPMSSFPGIVDGNEVIHEVKYDSIAQLVGYDKDGKELYDGDSVFDSHGDSYTVRLAPILENDKGVLIFADLPDDFQIFIEE